MKTKREIDRQAHLWALGIGLSGAVFLVASAAAAAWKRSRMSRIEEGASLGEAPDDAASSSK